jgi:hypothetical protein
VPKGEKLKAETLKTAIGSVRAGSGMLCDEMVMSPSNFSSILHGLSALHPALWHKA